MGVLWEFGTHRPRMPNNHLYRLGMSRRVLPTYAVLDSSYQLMFSYGTRNESPDLQFASFNVPLICAKERLRDHGDGRGAR